MNNNAPVGSPTPVRPPVPTEPPLNMFVNANNQAVQIPNGARTPGVSSTFPAPARPSNNIAPPPYPGLNSVSSDQAANTARPPYPDTASSDQASNEDKSSLVVIDIHQIRVGVRKFLPMPNSSVLFKDDGVLFTLKGKRKFLGSN